MNVREEKPADIDKIWNVNSKAFASDTEADLVNTLRSSGCVLFHWLLKLKLI